MYATGCWALAFAIAGIVIPVAVLLYTCTFRKGDVGWGMAWGVLITMGSPPLSLMLEIVAVVLGYRSRATTSGHDAFCIGIDVALLTGILTAMVVKMMLDIRRTSRGA